MLCWAVVFVNVCCCLFTARLNSFPCLGQLLHAACLFLQSLLCIFLLFLMYLISVIIHLDKMPCASECRLYHRERMSKALFSWARGQRRWGCAIGSGCCCVPEGGAETPVDTCFDGKFTANNSNHWMWSILSGCLRYRNEDLGTARPKCWKRRDVGFAVFRSASEVFLCGQHSRTKLQLPKHGQQKQSAGS